MRARAGVHRAVARVARRVVRDARRFRFPARVSHGATRRGARARQNVTVSVEMRARNLFARVIVASSATRASRRTRAVGLSSMSSRARCRAEGRARASTRADGDGDGWDRYGGDDEGDDDARGRARGDRGLRRRSRPRRRIGHPPPRFHGIIKSIRRPEPFVSRRRVRRR